MSLPTFQSAKGVTPDVEVRQLKDFIVRGEPAYWCVYVDNDASHRYENYGEALAKLDSLTPKFGASLVLYTRIGTMVTFQYRETVKVE